MTSTSAYDEKLLSQAPEVTKADLQDGYNADLLREANVKRTTSTRIAPTPPPLRSNSDHQFHQHDKDIESAAAPLQPKENVIYQEPRKPWWRTVKGIAVIAVVAIIIILAAVLGGVLGSRKSKPSTDLLDQPQGNSTSGGADQGSGATASGNGSSTGSASSTSSGSPPTATQPSSGNTQNTAGNSNGGTSEGGAADTGSGAAGNTNNGSNGGGGSGRPVEGSTPVAGDGSGNTLSSRSEGLAVEVLLRNLGVQL
ncbi:hypothetical protein NP233_g2538 [Leucocoprinus birnbaumii]|uniref:Uncharacterized protein n=1 Tax=Leucocoprinus birnbaumii TaxID=56174 RepID=A0AAD5YTN2_9AGAR|nr:hypothetical protein NP233_g2538 [Leucocoprinus birnbaumii]